MELILTPKIIESISIPIDQFIYLWLRSIEVTPNFSCNVPLIIEGYLYPSGNIAPKGMSFIQNVLGNVYHKVDNYEQLHKELQDRLFVLTGKKQVKANGSYTFLCNSIDLKSRLTRVITKYKLADWEKVKKLLLSHVEKAHNQKFDKVMLIQYYIEKNGNSNLASDYESFTEEKTTTFKSNQKFV